VRRGLVEHDGEHAEGEDYAHETDDQQLLPPSPVSSGGGQVWRIIFYYDLFACLIIRTFQFVF
jgi:hypothetical protein